MAVFEQDKPLSSAREPVANCTHMTLLLYDGHGVLLIPFPIAGERIYTSFGQCQAAVES